MGQRNDTPLVLSDELRRLGRQWFADVQARDAAEMAAARAIVTPRHRGGNDLFSWDKLDWDEAETGSGDGGDSD